MTIFTKIINREIPAEILFENDNIIVIKDIQPQAKTHLLIIPKKEIPTINDLESTDAELLAEMFFVAKDLAKKLGIENGYKLHFNVGQEGGPEGGQEVMHIHLHLLSNIK